MKNRWKCAIACLFVMVLLAGFVPIQNAAINSVNAVTLDASADASGDVSIDADSNASGDVSSDADSNVSGDASSDADSNASGDVSSDASSNASGDTSSDAGNDTSTDASANVCVTITDKGDFVVGEDEEHTLMVRVPIHVTDVDEDGMLTFNDAMMITHEQYCKDGYSTSMGDWGLSVSKLWRDESFNFGYYVDDKSAGGPKEPICEGSDIVAYIHKIKNPYQYDNYSFFNKKECSAKADETIILNLAMQGYDENWNMITLPCEDAELGVIAVSSGMVNFTSINKVTDASGNAVVSFANPGVYVVSARESFSADAAIVPPVCIITVEEDTTSKNPEQPVNPVVPQPEVPQPENQQSGNQQSGNQQSAASQQTTETQVTTSDTPVTVSAASQQTTETQVTTSDTPVTVSGPDAKALALQKTKQKISSVKSKKAKQVTVTFKKNKNATGYQVQYATSKKFTKKATKTLLVKKTSYTIKKLKRKKTYYVRVRSVRKVNGKNYYGKYSTVKKIVVK